MAAINLSDMFARQVFQSLLRNKPVSGRHVGPLATPPSLSLAQMANISSSDGPAAPTLEENTYFDKYKEKLAKVKQSKPEQYKTALDGIYGSKNKATGVKSECKDVKGASVMSKMRSTSKSQMQETSSSQQAKKKKGLDSIIKLDLFQNKTTSEISQIWSQYYAKKEGVIFATIPVEKYNRLKIKGKEYPLFIYVIPRDSSYEFMLGQCSEDNWYYTPLIMYQSHGEYAPYSLCVQYYTELVDSNGIVLMKGEIASEDLQPELATLLVHQTQLMYGSDENFQNVKLMNEKPNEFKHMEIVEICKNAGIF